MSLPLFSKLTLASALGAFAVGCAGSETADHSPAKTLEALEAAGPTAQVATYDPSVCNGRADLCDRPYNRVTFPATHDSYAASEYVPQSIWSFLPLYKLVAKLGFVDQDFGITRQLNDGIRALDLRLLPDTRGGYQLCHAKHGICQLEMDFLLAFLRNPEAAFNEASLAFSTPDRVFAELAQFLASHRDEVVTLSVQIRETPEFVFTGLLERHGLTQYLHTHTPETAWATLREMIKNNQRLVVLWDQPTSGAFLSSDDFVLGMGAGWADKWTIESVVNECEDIDPKKVKVDSIFELSHHMSMSAASLAQPGFNTSALQLHAFKCIQKYHLSPTLINVDLYDTSSLFKVVNDVNSHTLQPPPEGVWEVVTDGAKCGWEMGESAAICGYTTVTDAAKCGWQTAENAAKCGTEYGANAAKCGADTFTDGAKCGWHTISDCFTSWFQDCNPANTCSIPRSCTFASTCTFEATCQIAATCNIPKTCRVQVL